MATGAAPWAKYAQQGDPTDTQESGPWSKYSGSSPATTAASPSQGILAKLASNWDSNTQPKPSDGTLGTVVHNIGGRAAQGLVSPVLHPVDTLSGLLNMGLIGDMSGKNPLVQRGREFAQEYNQDKPLAFENAAGDALGMAAGAGLGGAGSAALKPYAGAIGDAMQAKGGTLIDRAAGSLAKDFKRGAEPGLSYLQGGGKPAFTMQGLATKAGNVADAAGAAIRPTLASNASVIPTDAVFDAVAAPAAKLRALQNGPGGVGSSPSLDAYEGNLLPALQKGSERGGFTAAQLYDELKQPIQKTTNWKDQTMFDLNKVRQNTTGSLGGLIADQVPEVRPLNDIFRGASNLQQRAQLRANTGSSPLSTMGRRAIEAGVGHAAFGPGGAALSALDSVPGLTSAGYGLFKAGGIVPPATQGLSFFTGPAIAAAVGNKKKSD